jgi:hypothetical protein
MRCEVNSMITVACRSRDVENERREIRKLDCVNEKEEKSYFRSWVRSVGGVE